MRYTSPIYEIEAIKTSDVICNSPYTVTHVNKVIGTKVNEQGQVEEIKEMSTLVTVDVNGLF